MPAATLSAGHFLDVHARRYRKALAGFDIQRFKPALVVTVALLAGAIVGVAASPLGEMLQERIDNPHSNDRRSQLVVETVQSTTAGSPVVGFGSTRDVQGSFASIAGGDTPDCPACAVPPLGTQGHLWMLVFSQGLVGAALFLSFVLVSARRAWACRTENQVLCTFVLLFFVNFVLTLVYFNFVPQKF